MRKWIVLAMLALTGLVCSVSIDPGSSTPDVGAIVAATLTAAAGPAQSVATATVTPAVGPTETSAVAPTDTAAAKPTESFPEIGTISGTLSYPAEGIPPLRIVAFPTGGGAPSFKDTAAGQNTYSLDVQAGTYHVVAYTIGGDGFPSGLAGGYTQYVPCGLSASCSDHSFIDVVVTAGATVTGVDPQDWYAPDGTFPPAPVP